MVFSSLLFLFQFLAGAFLLYYISPKKAKNAVFLAVSLLFYAWGELQLFPVMAAVVAVNYGCALGMNKFDDRPGLRRLMIGIALTASFGSLFVFKYLDFFIGNANSIFAVALPYLRLPIPLGISFFTLQSVSYSIDVYRRKMPAERNFLHVALFAALFPNLIAGPIVRYTDISEQLRDRAITPAMLDDGMEDFVIGLARKVLIANNVGALWAEVEGLGFASISSGLAWLALIAFSLQIYFDFSGYCQMAIGLGKMLGFRLPKNFDNPYAARSVTEFWRKWHITLNAWFGEYVLFPITRTRKTFGRSVLGLFVVWLLIGLWHGASWNFALWGVYFFVLFMIEKLGLLGFLNKHRVFSHIYTVFLIVVGWALFQIPDFAALGTFFTKMFVPTFLTGDATVLAGYYLRNYAVSIAVGGFLCTQLASNLYAKLRARKWLRNIVLVGLFLVCVAYLADSAYNPFLYFRI